MSLVTVEEEQGNVVRICHLLRSKSPFNQLYISNNTEHFSFKSGHSVHITKFMKTNWLVVLQ